MIPGPLVPPVAVTRLGAPRVATGLRVLAVLLVLAAATGGLSWALLLSPITMTRWTLFESTLEFNAKAPGTYVIYEEGPGEADRVGPPVARISVRAVTGRKIPATSLIDEKGHSSTTYWTPFREGRALLSFEVDHAGIYELFAFQSPDTASGSITNASGAQGQSVDLTKLPLMAVAPEGVPASLGTLPGLFLVSGLPLVVAAGLLVYAARRWPSPLRVRRQKPAPARTRQHGSLVAHGRS